MTTIFNWTLGGLYENVKKQEVMVPTLQRKLKWKEEQNVNFVSFFRKYDTMNPIWTHERVSKRKITYCLFEGNNRVTCMLLYYQTPLKYIEGVAPSILYKTPSEYDFLLKADLPTLEASSTIKELLTTIAEITQNEEDKKTAHTLLATCDAHRTELSAWLKHIRKTVLPVDRDGIRTSSLHGIKVAVGVYKGPSENIPDIYKSINTGGTPMCITDVLAAVLSETRVDMSWNVALETQMKKRMQTYYETKKEGSILKHEAYDSEKDLNAFMSHACSSSSASTNV